LLYAGWIPCSLAKELFSIPSPLRFGYPPQKNNNYSLGYLYDNILRLICGCFYLFISMVDKLE